MVRRQPLVRREAWRVGILAGAAAAVAITVVVVSSGRAALFRNDGEMYWLVAQDPFGDGSSFHSVPGLAELYGVAYRYGRMLYPALAWVLAGGQTGLPVELALMAVEVVAFGAAVALACELVARRGAPVSMGVAVLVVPAMWFSCRLALSEPLVIALILLTYLLALDGRERPAMVSAVFLLLAREAAVVALVPLVLDAWRRRDRAALARWALVPLPLLGWWTWVRVRVGEWPPLDPSVSRREATALPPDGVTTVVSEGLTVAHGVAFVLGVATVAAAIWMWRRARWWPVTDGALVLALVLLVLGPNAWRYPSESIRLMAPAQILIVIGLVAARTDPRGRVPEAAGAAGTARR